MTERRETGRREGGREADRKLISWDKRMEKGGRKRGRERGKGLFWGCESVQLRRVCVWPLAEQGHCCAFHVVLHSVGPKDHVMTSLYPLCACIPLKKVPIKLSSNRSTQYHQGGHICHSDCIMSSGRACLSYHLWHGLFTACVMECISMSRVSCMHV